MRAVAVSGACSLAAIASLFACGHGGGGGGAAEPTFTDDDRAAILDEVTATTSSLAAALAGSLVFVPGPATETSRLGVAPKATLSCTPATSGGTCSCEYGGEYVHCHGTFDEQELCDVSGSKWLTGSFEATGAPNYGSVDGNATLKLGPPPCVVAGDLTIDGTLVTTISGQSTGDVFHMLYRLFSSGVTATRAGREVGVCIVDVTVTESGASGTMCGRAWP